MADISKTSEQSLNNILNKLGVRTQEDVKKEGNKNTLGSRRFFKAHDHSTSKSRSVCSNG